MQVKVNAEGEKRKTSQKKVKVLGSAENARNIKAERNRKSKWAQNKGESWSRPLLVEVKHLKIPAALPTKSAHLNLSACEV